MAKPKPDPVEWAKTQRRRTGGVVCTTCSNVAAMAVLKAWIPLWRSGDITISGEQARAYLAEHCDYKSAVGSLRKCLSAHHGFRVNG